MNKLDKDYLNLVQDILNNGVKKTDRTGTGTLSIFSRQIRHKMSDGFPILTTKKIHFKSVVTELLWFLRGDTNIKYLVDNNCNIWNGDAYLNWKNKGRDFWEEQVDGMFTSELGEEVVEKISKEWFINKIKTDDEFAKQWGELGPIYGSQWRSWGYREDLKLVDNNRGDFEYEKVITTGVDQISNLINNLKTNPDSRRLMVSAWNVGELDQMTLPPCHYTFQVYTRELHSGERQLIAEQRGYRGLLHSNAKDYKSSKRIIQSIEETCDSINIPKRAISLSWNQRSVDVGLGLGFNIASYGLLLEIIAKEVNMVPDELIGNLGDTHLYLNHVEPIKEQFGRELTLEEKCDWLNKNYNIGESEGWTVEKLLDNDYLKEVEFEYNVPKTTREPFKLPTLKIHGNVDDIAHYEISDFTLENYLSHPTIKLPLSN
jgi:thymidylate synthase